MRKKLRLSTPPTKQQEPKVLEYENIEIDRRSHQATVSGNPVFLRYKEFEILWLLIRYKGAIVRVRDINEILWGNPFGVLEETVASLIRQIRDKLGTHTGSLIENVSGVGYRIGGRILRDPSRTSPSFTNN